MNVTIIDVWGEAIPAAKVTTRRVGQDGLRVLAKAPGYRPAGRTTFRDADSTTIVLPLDPNTAVGPPRRDAVRANIEAKLRHTVVGGSPLFDLVTEEISVRKDRVFYQVSAEMANVLERTGAVGAVSGSLHDPPAGFESVASYKTPDDRGNLQITLFRRGNRWRADVDIDEAAGIRHGFEVLRNHLTGHKTHPYDVHQILVWYQGIDPGYELNPG